MVLTESEIEQHAIASYMENNHTGGFFVEDEFKEDFGRFLVILRALRRMCKGKDINVQVIKNEYITLNNQFGDITPKLLVYFGYTKYIETLPSVAAVLNYFHVTDTENSTVEIFGKTVKFNAVNKPFMERLEDE